jgi:hypothetical protein
MFSEIATAASAENLLGGRLESAAEALLADPALDLGEPGVALQVATAQVLLALYWEMRHQYPAAEEPGGEPGGGLVSSLEWVSALLCSSLSPEHRLPAP